MWKLVYTMSERNQNMSAYLLKALFYAILRLVLGRIVALIFLISEESPNSHSSQEELKKVQDEAEKDPGY